jgi:hypothetical protein
MHNGLPKGAQGVPAPQAMRETLTTLIRDDGETAVARRLNIGRQTLGRIVGGLTVRPGTIALIQNSLAVPPAPEARHDPNPAA